MNSRRALGTRGFRFPRSSGAESPILPRLLTAALALGAAATSACSPAGGGDAGGGQAERRAGAPDAPEERPAPGDLLRLAAVARGFPALRDLGGRTMARGDFAQWMEEGRLHLRILFRFEDGDRRIEERAVLAGEDGIVQESWSWDETRGGQRFRRFAVDFGAGTAEAVKRGEDGLERWSEEIDVEPGRTFAGFAFALVVAAHRDRLVGGEAVELRAVAFTPEPRVADVEISHGGAARVPMGGRTVEGDRFDVVPQVPWYAELFVDAPETRIWLTRPPAGFLRSEGPLAEPGDPVVRVDLLPGGESGPATPEERDPEG